MLLIQAHSTNQTFAYTQYDYSDLERTYGLSLGTLWFRTKFPKKVSFKSVNEQLLAIEVTILPQSGNSPYFISWFRMIMMRLLHWWTVLCYIFTCTNTRFALRTWSVLFGVCTWASETKISLFRQGIGTSLVLRTGPGTLVNYVAILMKQRMQCDR